jgi:hypothetical protein
MDLDDFFDRDSRRGRHGQRGHDHDGDHGHDGPRHRQHDDYQYGQTPDDRSDRWLAQHDRHRGHRDDDELFDLSRIPQRLRANKKLLIPVGVALLLVIALAATFLLPLVSQIVDYVGKRGLIGVVEALLKGAGGGQ